MSDFKFECPHCKQHLQCDEKFSGREIQCPKCSHLIHIPPVPGRTAQYNPESGKTWATFVGPADGAKPKGLSIERKGDRPKPPGK
jgi:DNA-directed RNA polymerase subunit RPC12/RpoP